MALITSLFLLALAVFAGRAGQTGIYYICGLIVPSFVFLNVHLDRKFLTRTLYLGLSLMGLCLVFSLSNFINEYAQAPDFAGANFVRPTLKFNDKLESQLSSSIFFTGVYLGCWAIIKILATKFLSGKSSRNFPNLATKFDQFLLIASCILGIWVVIQMLTGFDFRPSQAYRPDHRYASGLYRAEGFFSHPLTLASVCLAFFGYYWTFFWNSISQRKLYLAIALIHLFCIFASGGRIAVLIALGAFVSIPLAVQIKKISPRKILAILATTIVSACGLLYVTGIWERFAEVFTRGDERSIFWKVYWQLFLDRPWFGHGHSWIPFYRDSYYTAMGFGELARKYNAHNIYLQTLADSGLIGLALLIVFIVLIWKLSSKLIGDSASSYKKTAFNVAIILNLLHGFTQNTFFDSGVTFVYLNLFIVMFWTAATRSEA